MHMLFAAICFFASTCSVFQALVLTSDSVPGFIQASRWNLSLTGIFAVCMLWFVASYTRIVPKLLLSGLTLVIALAIVAALTQPQGLQFDSITGLSRGTLPWGEAYTRAEGRISWVFKLGLLALFTTFIYMIYATASVVRRNPSRNNIGMLLAVVFYVMCYTEGSLVRANVIDFLPLGPYGVLGFILVMSMALNQQHSDERKAAALAIEEEHRRLETILKTANEGIYILDPDGLLVEANDAFLKSHGLDKSAIGRLHASAWNPQLEGRALQQRIQSIRDAGGIKAFESTHCRSDGSVFDVEINANVFHFGGVSYLFNSARDITERKLQQQELERRVAARTEELATARAEAESASAVKTRFMTNVSHEMRTPMNGILGFAEIGKARADKQGAEKLAGYFEKILVSGRRLNTLTESLLSLAEDAWNQQAGIAEEGFHRVSPEALVIQCISLAEKTAETRRHRIVYENLSTISAIRGDEARLRQVLEHLLNNAIRYSPEETTVAVKIQDKPAADGRAAEISIQVIDEGCGVPEKEMRAIFEPFYESSRTATGAGGTGLGLALCKSILQRHKGAIGVSNRPEGGAIFEITLPQA